MYIILTRKIIATSYIFLPDIEIACNQTTRSHNVFDHPYFPSACKGRSQGARKKSWPSNGYYIISFLSRSNHAKKISGSSPKFSDMKDPGISNTEGAGIPRLNLLQASCKILFYH